MTYKVQTIFAKTIEELDGKVSQVTSSIEKVVIGQYHRNPFSSEQREQVFYCTLQIPTSSERKDEATIQERMTLETAYQIESRNIRHLLERGDSAEEVVGYGYARADVERESRSRYVPPTVDFI